MTLRSLLQNDVKVAPANAMEEPLMVRAFGTFKKESLAHLYVHYETKDSAEIFTEETSSITKGAVHETVTRKKAFLNID